MGEVDGQLLRFARLFSDAFLGLGIHPLDVVLEVSFTNPPLTTASHLDGPQFTATDQGIGLVR